MDACLASVFLLNFMPSYLASQDLPYDPTGELDSLRSFIEENIDVCKWVGLAVVIIQV